MTDAYICDAIRTPIGRYGGALAGVRADDLAAVPLAGLVSRNPTVDWGALDDVILGRANQAGEDNRNVARMAALLASYFDVLFAANELPHPGEKRILQYAKASCKRLPSGMERQVMELVKNPADDVLKWINALVDGLDELLVSEGLTPKGR